MLCFARSRIYLYIACAHRNIHSPFVLVELCISSSSFSPLNLIVRVIYLYELVPNCRRTSWHVLVRFVFFLFVWICVWNGVNDRNNTKKNCCCCALRRCQFHWILNIHSSINCDTNEGKNEQLLSTYMDISVFEFKIDVSPVLFFFLQKFNCMFCCCFRYYIYMSIAHYKCHFVNLFFFSLQLTF